MVLELTIGKEKGKNVLLSVRKLKKMKGYKYRGMKIINKQHAFNRFKSGKSVYALRSDNTESLIENKQDFESAVKNGEKFGTEK